MGNQYKVRTITCTGCGQTVTKRMRQTSRYCSLGCYRVSKRPLRKTGKEFPCHTCGTLIYIVKSRLGAPRYFCSNACQSIWQGRNKTSHSCKICGKMFRWSPSRTQSSQYNVTYCSLACRNADPKRRELLIEMNVAQQQGRQTAPERIGYDILDSLGIEYKAQHLIGGKFCVDAFVPSARVVVQFDGDYWHGHPLRFAEPDPRQLKRMRLDKSQDAYMAACGNSVIRIWETDLKHNPEAVTARLRLLLVPDTHTPAAQA